MSIADDIQAVLAVNVPLMAVLTGGLYTFEETGRNGVSQKTTPSAYDATSKKVKPCGVIRERAMVADGFIRDAELKHTSYRQMIEIWLYNDGGADKAVLQSAEAVIYGLLHEERVGASKILLTWMNSLRDDREIALDRAHAIKLDFEARGIRS